MMRRHLLTLFALFTGLAALHAPASAAALQSQVMNAQAQASGDEATTQAADHASARAEDRSGKCPPKDCPPRPMPFTDGLRPPVIFGSERALE